MGRHVRRLRPASPPAADRLGAAPADPRRLSAPAEQREPVADRAGGVLLWRAKNHLLRPRKIDPTITRHTGEAIQVEVHRTLPQVLKRLREEGYPLVGLEQTNGSQSLYDFRFPRRMVLVIGNERLGIEDEVLRLLQHTVEIPVYGLPYSHNVATAAAMALYEYCRQYPKG